MNKEDILKLKKICVGFKVLCVEDDMTIANQLKRVLSNIFSTVDIEVNGLAGLEKFKQVHHEIVIADISMPIMNGVKMAHEIKKINKDQSIIIVSAHSETKYMTSLIDIGVDKFIAKPVDIESFLDVLAKSAIKVYREKKQEKLDSKYKKQLKIQESILSELITPIITIKNSKINYVNKIFKDHFLKNTDGSLEEFNLSYIFKDKDFVVLNNDEIVKKLSNHKSIYQLYHADKKIYKNYKIDVVNTDEEGTYLLSLINMDSIKHDLDKLLYFTMDFSGRRAFLENILLLKDSGKKYKIYCFGLKNISEYIKEYGVKQINTINKTVSNMIKKEFAQKLEDGELDIYLFDTNRYIAVIDKNNYEFMQESLSDFGTNYKYSKGKEIGLHLDFISNDLDFNLSKHEILEDAQAMLYMLKG